MPRTREKDGCESRPPLTGDTFIVDDENIPYHAIASVGDGGLLLVWVWKGMWHGAPWHGAENSHHIIGEKHDYDSYR